MRSAFEWMDAQAVSAWLIVGLAALLAAYELWRVRWLKRRQRRERGRAMLRRLEGGR
jgi:hypothetical protein